MKNGIANSSSSNLIFSRRDRYGSCCSGTESAAKPCASRRCEHCAVRFSPTFGDDVDQYFRNPMTGSAMDDRKELLLEHEPWSPDNCGQRRVGQAIQGT
jgi:hypothetical protein